MAWARKYGVAELDVTAPSEEVAGTWARRAACFTSPPRVWVDGRPAVPAPPVVPAPLSAADAAFASLIVEAGAEPVVEHGVLYGEVLGLEVCRVVDGRLEVGVGRHDREAQRLIHGDRPPVEALRTAVEVVRRDRPAHLAAARWLRWVVVRKPELVGVSRLEPVPPPSPRGDLRVPQPAAAVGDDVVVVCSTGIDLDLVPTAADARLSCAPGARLLLVVPEGDDHPVTRALAALLRDPADVATVPRDWRSIARLP